MQIKIFTIPVIGDENKAIENELNLFLCSHRILNLSKHLVTNNDSSMWCFCVEYIEGSKTVGVNEASSPKVDYKDVLSEDEFEKFQIFDSYVCRKGKGVDACLKRAVEFCKKYRWYLKLDIHKYYDSIHHDIMMNILKSRFKDGVLLAFFSNLLGTYCLSEKRGIPIGNLLSQYFANMYLAVLDHEIKDRLRIKGYLRYMDKS